MGIVELSCHAGTLRLLLIMGIVFAAVIVFQFFELPQWSYASSLSPALNSSTLEMIRNASLLRHSEYANFYGVPVVANNTNVPDLEEEAWNEDETKTKGTDYDLASDNNDRELNDFLEIVEDKNALHEVMFEKDANLDISSTAGHVKGTDNSPAKEKVIGKDAQERPGNSDDTFTLNYDQNGTASSTTGEVQKRADIVSVLMSPGISTNDMGNLVPDSGASVKVSGNMSAPSNPKKAMEKKLEDKNDGLLQAVSVTLNTSSIKANDAILLGRGRRRRRQPTSIKQMNSLLLQGFVSSSSMRPRWSSVRDRELLSAKLQIRNAPIVRKTPGLHASLFRNVSMFKRSYELMERMLKVYIYEEGERPIFHQPRLKGIYASEGWFMKMIERNKKFVVRDHRKAHLFFLPLGSKMLRISFQQSSHSGKEMEKYLKSYVNLIAQKYNFWNRTDGADHFIVACHDWAPLITEQLLQNSIRALCNANVARGFKIGKDTSLAVTYVREVDNPLKDLGGKPPSERPILAFFAGSMHGYLRPVLLKYWENKEPDMNIFGPMPRNTEGKKSYREHMKSSKYCICARGYEVHTPRVVEAIFSECVPVIISDNYVPPFFEILQWEAFAVFIQERDVQNLRNILLSIPEEKYLKMQQRVKMAQQHFLWHKRPVKYDLFHMILHSVWYIRVFRTNS